MKVSYSGRAQNQPPLCDECCMIVWNYSNKTIVYVTQVTQLQLHRNEVRNLYADEIHGHAGLFGDDEVILEFTTDPAVYAFSPLSTAALVCSDKETSQRTDLTLDSPKLPIICQPTLSQIEKMKWDWSLDFADATGSAVIKLFHISEVVNRRLDVRKITASLTLLKILLLPQVFEMKPTDICYLLPCDYLHNYLLLIIAGKEQFWNTCDPSTIALGYFLALLRFGRSYKSDFVLASTTQCIVPVKHESIYSSTWTNKDQMAWSTFLHQFKKKNFAEILIL